MPDRLTELEELIRAGWGDVRADRIPADWRDRPAPRPVSAPKKPTKPTPIPAGDRIPTGPVVYGPLPWEPKTKRRQNGDYVRRIREMAESAGRLDPLAAQVLLNEQERVSAATRKSALSGAAKRRRARGIPDFRRRPARVRIRKLLPASPEALARRAEYLLEVGRTEQP
jgi:hypothetical protein